MGKHRQIALLPGDGIGPEIMQATLPIIFKAAELTGDDITATPGLIGWAAYDKYHDTMPETTWKLCVEVDAILFGAVGLPGRDKEVAAEMRPERRALLPLRKHFQLGCNIRPVVVMPELAELSPLKDHLLKDGVNLTFFRELVGGDYFGERREDPDGQWAEDVCRYERQTIVSIARMAFDFAKKTGQPVTSIDKANVLGATGTFWRSIVQEVHDTEYPEVVLDHVYVDAFNMYLFIKPSRYSVILTSNAHGDILSDGAAGLAGSLGLLPSASINSNTSFGLYEPGGGSAPDIAGKGIANPIAMILSAAMMFRHSFGNDAAAEMIEEAVRETLRYGFRTKDLLPEGSSQEPVSTTTMANAVLDRLKMPVPQVA